MAISLQSVAGSGGQALEHGLPVLAFTMRNMLLCGSLIHPDRSFLPVFPKLGLKDFLATRDH
jgi:hypothetical protein